MPKLKNWNTAKRISLISSERYDIFYSVECLQLTTLFLPRNKISLGNISGEFFKSMPSLVVLDLSSNDSLTELTDGISELGSLKYLNLSRTSILCLPIGLQKLENLIHLDLERTEQMWSIVGVSSLLNLRVLKLYLSGVAYSSNTNDELKVLEHLEILTINIDSDSDLDEFLSSQKLMRCAQVLQIEDCHLESSDIWCLASMEKLRDLRLRNCTICEIMMDSASITMEMVSPLQNLKNAFFFSLSKISLYYCKCPKDLTWLMFAQNLTMLSITHGGNQVEEIINKEKAYEGIVPFQKLQNLCVQNLPELKNIYWKPLPFPCLKELRVFQCRKLRKLPLNSKSRKGFVIQAQRKWLEEVKWEDRATKARFLPLCSYS